MSDTNSHAGIDADSDPAASTAASGTTSPDDSEELGGEDTVKANDELDGDVER